MFEWAAMRDSIPAHERASVRIPRAFGEGHWLLMPFIPERLARKRHGRYESNAVRFITIERTSACLFETDQVLTWPLTLEVCLNA